MIANDTVGLIGAALVSSVLGIILVLVQFWLNSRTNRRVDDVHDEVRTNDGRRQGERIEQLNADVEAIREAMITKADLEAHAEHDLKVAAELRDENRETRHILLSAIQLKGQ